VRACHQPKHQQTGALAKGGISAARTFLGLPTRCGACHEDRHRGQFAGRDCSACHGLDDWMTGFPASPLASNFLEAANRAE